MKKKIISMLLTGILTFTGMPMYIQAAEFDESAASFEDFDDGSGAEESTVVSEDTVDEEETAAEAETLEEVEDEASADIYVNQDEQEEILLQEDTAGDTEQESTEENLELFSEAADTDVKSESEESGGTLTTGVSWKLSADGNLQISGSGAVEKESDGTYPWDGSEVLSVTVEKGITAIGSGAFASCTALKQALISADTLKTVSTDAFGNGSNVTVELYYSGDAPSALPVFEQAASEKVFYIEKNQTWSDAYKKTYNSVQWTPCCTINNLTANTEHSYVKNSDELKIQTDGLDYPTQENMAYYDAACSVCGNNGKLYNDCIHCIDTTDLQSDHPYSTETSTEWKISMKGAEEIILTFDERTQFETNYDDFFYIYDENGELYQKYINDQLSGKTVVIPGSSATLKLTTDYSTDEWGFAVTKAYGTTHEWESTVTKPAERDQTGILTKTCRKCGEVIEEVIPAPYIVCGDAGSVFWGITPDYVLEIAPEAGQDDISMGYYYSVQLNDHPVTNAPWGQYEKYVQGIRVKKGITHIGDSAFYGMSRVKWAEIDDGVRNIGSEVFYGCNLLKQVNIPKSITRIGSSAFSYTMLTSITVPASLKYCAKYAFSGCNIRSVYIEDLSQWLSMEEGPYLNGGASGQLCIVDYYINGELLEDLEIPENITNIRANVFCNASNIRTVTFHENIESIGEDAFFGCVNMELTRDKLPNYLQRIGAGAFSNCKKITQVALPSSVTFVGNAAFSDCSGMTQCLFARDIELEQIYWNTFYGCKSLERISIPSSVTSIGSNAFQECSNLREVEFSEESKLTQIGTSAFQSCSSLEKIKIPASMTSIGQYVFMDCNNLDEIVFLGDFGAFSSEFLGWWTGEPGSNNRKLTYYACNSTWNSPEAQAFLNNVSGYNVTPNPIHMSEDSITLIPATCTTEGEKTFVCDKCGETFTEILPALGHKLTQKEHKDPTCAEKGYDIQVCSVCNEEIRTELETDQSAHHYDERKVIDPTCFREGYTLYTCTVCGNQKREDYKPSTPHIYEDTVIKPTCQMQGYTLHQCKTCDYSYTDTWTEALDHDYKEIIKAPTCTERGYTYYSCKNCGYSYRDNFKGASGHQYKKEVIQPTCISEGYTINTCSVCNISYISDYREAKGHDYDKVVTAPTCTEKGYTTYTCKQCDNVVVSDYRSPLGHSYEAVTTDSTCTSKGFTTYTCTTCGNRYVGEETDKAPHKWDNGTIIKKSGYLESGLKKFQCTDCDAFYTEDIPALEQADLSDCTIVLSYRKTTYNGKEKTPKVTVKNSSGIVSANDYTVTYGNNRNAGEAKVVVTAKKGDICITGTVEKTFTIAKAKQSVTAVCRDEQIHIKGTTEIETDGIGTVTLTTDNKELIEIGENNQVTGKKAGLAVIKVTASGDSNHEPGSTTVAVGVDENHVPTHLAENKTTRENGDVEYDDVEKCSLCGIELSRTHKTLKNLNSDNCKIKLSASSYVFSGKEIKPTVQVSMDGVTLMEGTDYRLEYKDNAKVGKARVSVIGIGNYTNVKEQTFQILAPPKQPVLNTIKLNKSSVIFTWKKSEGAEGYYIYRKTSNSGWSKIGKTVGNDKLSFTDNKTKTGITYTYTVKAYAGSVESSYDKKGKSIIRLAEGQIASIANDSKGVKLTWKKIAGAQGYIIYRADGNGKYKTIKTITGTKTFTYTDTKAVSNGAKYTYAVCGYAGTTKGSYKGKTCYRLFTVSISSLKNSASKKITVKWKRNTKATGYQISYTTGKTQKTITVPSGKTVSKVLGSLKKGGTYSVKVRAYKTVSGTKYYSGWSAVKKVKVTV